MIRAHQPVMGGNFRLPPVAPAADRARRLWIGGELLGPRHQPVALAEGVGRSRVAAQIGFVAVPGETAELKAVPGVLARVRRVFDLSADPDAIARAEADRLEAEFDTTRIKQLIDAEGWWKA